MNAERRQKEKRKIALNELMVSRSKKEKRKMEVTEKEIADAVGARNFYVDKLNQIKKQIENMQKFENFTIFELNELKARLNDYETSFDQKCINLNCVDAQSGTSTENEAWQEECMLMNASIAKRIDQLKQPAQPTMQMQPKNETEMESNADLQKANAATSFLSEAKAATPIIQTTFNTFDGSMHEWHDFCRKFEAEVVNKNEINEETKLKILTDACSGMAARVISKSNANFNDAWNQLNDMFGESYMQIHFCLCMIAETVPIEFASSQNLAYLLDRGNKCIDILKQCAPENDFDTIFVIMMAAKLDGETARAWERLRNALAESSTNDKDATQKVHQQKRHLPKWDDFEVFMKKEIDMYHRFELRQTLQCQATSMQHTQLPGTSSESKNTQDEQKRNPAPVVSQQAWQLTKNEQPPEEQCSLCDGWHHCNQCDVFDSKGFVAKLKHVREMLTTTPQPISMRE